MEQQRCFHCIGGVLLGYALQANPTYDRRPPLALPDVQIHLPYGRGPWVLSGGKR